MRAAAKALVVLVLVVPPTVATGAPVNRTILALYDSSYADAPSQTPVHQIVEVPLNHLGLIVRYHDIQDGLPLPEEMRDVRGVITWFQSNTMPDPLGYLAWANAEIDRGTKFVIIGELSAQRDTRGNVTPEGVINHFWARLGIRSEEEWTRVTYNRKIVHRDPSMVEFERSWSGVLPQYAQMKRIDPAATSYLTVRRGDDPATDCELIVLHSNGGYIAGEYVHYYSKDLSQRQWYVNPFEFFRRAFNTDAVPKPDTTTLAGRRIFYSHVDGDGWRSVTEIPKYKRQKALAAEVILNEIIGPFSDLPVTVAPIAADIDPTWHGTPISLDLAKRILALPNVEAGTHTYSHPLDWAAAISEKPKVRSWLGSILSNMPVGVLRVLAVFWDPDGAIVGERMSTLKAGYEAVRTYDLKPFDLDSEIRGSVDFINRLLPQGKKVEVIQWSGDTTPPESVVAASRAAGIRNINGGDTRFDEDRLSYGWVSPLGRQVGSTWQIYASNSNENNYTELWTNRFFGFRYLTRTIANTESPIRIKPINVYYHMYSGEKLSSLNALMENLRYASTQEICPITAGQYAGVADGFYSASFDSLEANVWQIRNRGLLQTVRFDNASLVEVDFTKSSGVAGQRFHQGSLYVSLDAAAVVPIVALRTRKEPADHSRAARPYLVHSQWQVSAIRADERKIAFLASGYGPGGSLWQMPQPGRFMVRATSSSGNWTKAIESDRSGRLAFTVPFRSPKPVQVTIEAIQ